MSPRSTIDFGIDLGTTNSAIAVVTNGQVEVIKNNDGQELTPSAVWVRGAGSQVVGSQAYQRVPLSDLSVHTRFKRKMGMQLAAAGMTGDFARTPEQLAAAILKELRAAAETWARASITSAVIGVPANFELVQTAATQRAAKLAGITHAPLLQEPIAAGLAYGYQRQVGDSQFLVFDLGGGTLDVTLLRIRDGLLTVVAQDGDNFFGGCDWDGYLASYLSERLREEGHALWAPDAPEGQQEFRILTWLAEREKIRLSRVESLDFVIDGEVHDRNGDPVRATVHLGREQYEKLISADIDRAVGFTRKLLAAQGVAPADVSRLLLVGGPTWTPALRRALTEGLGIELETRIDPMTVVARGAAIFAGGLLVESARASHASPNELILRLAYRPVSGDTEASVGGRLESEASEGLQIEIRRADGGWSSGRLGLANGAFVTRVPLAAGLTNVFDIFAYDGTGTRRPTNPARFAITQGLTAGDPPLSRSIWIVGIDRESGQEKQVLMLRRGAALPAVHELTVRARSGVNPGQANDIIDIHVVEGDENRHELNRHVGYLRIDGMSVSRAVPAGTPIEVKIRVDISRGIVATAYVPLLDLSVEEVLQDKYLPTVDPEHLDQDLSRELERAAEVAGGRSSELAEIQRDAARLRTEIQQARAGDAEQAARADRELRKLKASIDNLAAHTEVERLQEQLRREVVWSQGLAKRVGDSAVTVAVAELGRDADSASASGNVERLQHAISALDKYYWSVALEQPWFWVEYFIALAEKVANSSRASAAAPLLREGRSALDRQDWDDLRRICSELWQMLPHEEQVASGLRNIGIWV